jgi:hypothetical protein
MEVCSSSKIGGPLFGECLRLAIKEYHFSSQKSSEFLNRIFNVSIVFSSVPVSNDL